jgi:hypothetical protein
MGLYSRATAAALALMLAAAGCAAPRRSAAPDQTRCKAPFNAGSRLPGALNPAYPAAGLYPAPGGLPPSGAPGVVLRVLAPALVIDYGQPLETGDARTANEVVQGVADNGWWRAPLAAGYAFRLFGVPVPLFAFVPAPVLTGTRARGARTVWVETQWDAAQTLTLLRGSDALAISAPSWRAVPPGVTPAHAQQAQQQIHAAAAAGWQPAGTFVAAPACGGSAGQLGPFGARAALRLPLGVPLLLVSPEDGLLVFEVSTQ